MRWSSSSEREWEDRRSKEGELADSSEVGSGATFEATADETAADAEVERRRRGRVVVRRWLERTDGRANTDWMEC